jgi:ribosomal protein S12 methylthiotransferase accessory factor
MRWRRDPPVQGELAAAVDQDPAQTLTPAEYWPRLRPHLGRFGLSRVADITGLDHVGFPVAQAVRPRARSNAVTQGKAVTLDGAAVGAVLECLEMAAGEDLTGLPDAPPGDGALWRALAPGADWPDADTGWIAAWDVLQSRVTAIPRDVVSTDFTQGAPAQAAPILRQSIGLGAGTTLAAALWHGLLECIEADARLRAAVTGAGPRITLAPGNALYGAVLECAETAGLRVAVHAMPDRAGLASVMASVMERPGASALPLPAQGFATRPAPGAAIAAAIAEALQARLAAISGAREDLTQRVYAHQVPPDLLDAEWVRHGPAPGITLPAATATDWTVSKLAHKVGPVFALVLHWDPQLPLAITRIVAPMLVADPLRLAPAP